MNQQTEKERLETEILRYQLLVNHLTFLTMQKGLENDALRLQVETEIKGLIRNELNRTKELQVH